MQENLTLVNKSLPSPPFFFLLTPWKIIEELANHQSIISPSPCLGKSAGEGFRLTYFQDLLFKLFSNLCSAAMTG